MTELHFSDSWEKLPNDLYISKQIFSGVPRTTIGVFNAFNFNQIKLLDDFFKTRKKKKNLNRSNSDFSKQAHSEIFIHKDSEQQVYCFNGVIFSPEQYSNSNDIDYQRDYTIMLLSDFISLKIKKILTSNEVNQILKVESSLEASKERRKRIETAHEKRF